MISCRDEKEKEIILHCALSLSDRQVVHIVQQGEVHNAAEASHLARFLWTMVDGSIKDNERIMASLRAYLMDVGKSGRSR